VGATNPLPPRNQAATHVYPSRIRDAEWRRLDDPRHTPVIQINGDNPAVIHVGDTYAELGATITGPQADLDLGIKTFLNGTLVSNIVIDTSSVATDTIDYVATDSTGLTSTSTRTILIEPTAVAPATSPSAANTASSTEATNSAQYSHFDPAPLARIRPA
jgi:Domain of unknown function (DUF5011)